MVIDTKQFFLSSFRYNEDMITRMLEIVIQNRVAIQQNTWVFMYEGDRYSMSMFADIDNCSKFVMTIHSSIGLYSQVVVVENDISMRNLDINFRTLICDLRHKVMQDTRSRYTPITVETLDPQLW